ncbi:MAG TPA: 23S rRNA pseudouridine(2604) synthase RluF [Flavobacteriales bacterium]
MSIENLPPGLRLNKYISDTGHCSRREADKLIEEGRVTINGKVPELGTRVQEGDLVAIDGQKIGAKKAPIYIAFNKPVGITCTTETHVKGNIISYINHPERIFPIGRLDKPSDGLIFLTNDGDIVNKILRAGNNHEKEYIVTVDKAIDDSFVQRMQSSVKILGVMTKRCKVRKEGKKRFRIILTQGLNRQIRRMCQTLGYEVQTLQRVRIMNVTLEGLAVGKWRYLTTKEIDEINQMVANSSKTHISSDNLDDNE